MPNELPPPEKVYEPNTPIAFVTRTTTGKFSVQQNVDDMNARIQELREHPRRRLDADLAIMHTKDTTIEPSH